MKRLDETHGTKFELVRHFLARMFDSEMFSMRGRWGTVAISAFAMAVPAGMLLLDPPYYHRPVGRTPQALRAVMLADQLTILTLVCAVTGILALLAWQSLFPSRRDYLALAGFPVRSRQVFAARFASVALLAIGTTLLISLSTSVMAPHQFTAHGGPHASALTRALAGMVASGLASLSVFFAIVGLQGLLINVLPARAFTRWSTSVQGALLATFFFGGLFGGFVVDWQHQAMARLPELGAWAPPVWFLGVRQAIAGNRDPYLDAMARRALAAAAGSVIFAALMYAAAYSRYRKLLLESPDAMAQRRAWKWSLPRLLARDPRRQAVMEFMANVLSRSRMHRLVLMGYAGAGVALMINSVMIAGAAHRWSGGWPEILRFVALYWPIGLSFVALAGVRHAFSMPAELRANWLFQITESQGRREWMSAVERFVIGCVIVPLHLVTFCIAAAVIGWPVAARMTALQLLVALCAFDLLFYSWQQLPFTCSYVPGKHSLVALFGTWLAVLTVVLPALARIVAGLSQMLEVFLFYFVLFAALWLWARRRRRDGWGEARLMYEDPHDAVADLGIRDLSYRPFEQVPEEHRVIQVEPRSQPVAVSLRLYRRLASAFPYEFKSAYGDELLQVTEESIEQIWRRYGVPGLARLLLDIAIRIPAEYLAELRQDIRHGLRMLAGSPGFTGVALVSLSLGICVATSAFSEMNGMVLRDVPGVAKPDQLIGIKGPSSFPAYQRYRERTDLFSSTLAYAAPVPLGVSLSGRTERTWGHLVTASYFSTLGVRPLLGRVFAREHDQPGSAPVVVVSHQFWQNHLGSDPTALGQPLRINGQPCTIIGVGPKQFLGASPTVYGADLWLPISVGARVAPELAGNVLERYDRAIFHVVGRLQPGVPAERAEAALDTMARQLELEYGDPDRNQKGRRVRLAPGGKLIPIPKEDLPFFVGYFTLLGGMILLIASSNVANMMLARAADRRREIAVRLALGAGRARLIRQLLTESLLVAAGAGTIGFLLSVWVMRGASQIKMPYPMPISLDLTPDGRVLLFTIALSIFTGIAFGLIPALQSTSSDLTSALKEGGNVRLRRYRRLSLRNMLMLSQVAGSLMLLLITGFLVLGHRKMVGGEVGFEARNLWLISLDPVRDGYSATQAANFFPRLLDRVKALPSVAAANLADAVPMTMIGRPAVTFSVAGADGTKVIHAGRKFVVGRDFFETMGIPILSGRAFRKQDEANDTTSVIVSEKLARECWKGEDPLGRRIEIGDEDVPEFGFGGGGGARGRRVLGKPRQLEVVGVTRNIRDGLTMVAANAPPMFFLPLRAADYARPNLQGVTLMVRAAPGVDAVAAVRREIAAIDDRLTPYSARSMPDQIDQIMFPVRMAVWTYAVIGVCGLILASVGLAGVTAYSVTQRRREIGIRMALGARRSDVLALVMKEGAVLITMGSVFGLAGAWAGMRMLAGFLSQVARTAGASTSDPLLLVGAPLLLAGLALAACYLPARKSTRIDPVVTLRQE